MRWYLHCKLSFRDLAETMAERGLSLAHTMIMRQVKRFTPESVCDVAIVDVPEQQPD